LPPGTPKERVSILADALRKTFKDPEFRPYFKKLVADDASPLDADQLTRVVTEIPRDAETLDLLRQLSGAGPLPSR
jgi:tripartite-type tricarboxylate transporter receptor subunit TctC